MRGIDISQGSGNIDFYELKKSGYEFVIARAGWGSHESQKDERFDDYVRLAHDAGLHVGAYWFMYCEDVPEAQRNALCFSKVCEKYRGILDMPLYMDYENDSTRYYQNKTGKQEERDFVTACISVACLQLEQNGWYAGYYVNLDYYKNHIVSEFLKRFTLWLALWRSENAVPDVPCGMWQFAGDTKIKEASGGVDFNKCFSDFPNAIRQFGLNGFKSESAAPDLNIGGHSIYDRNIQIHANGTWSFT